MLTELRIRNFAIIEQVTLPLAPGFNVLSGETGAGKSIIVGALGLLLGERASADLIRSGAEQQADRVRGVSRELSEVRREIANLSSRRADAEKRADYLRHVAKEIEDARLSPGEDTKLEDEARVLENADELRTLASTLNELLSAEEGSVLSQLGAAQRPLSSIERIDPAAARMQELFDAGFYALQELARNVEDYAGSLELDPTRLEEVRRRRDRLFGLLKKYGPTLDNVIESGRSARAELDLVDTAQFDLANLNARESELRKRLVSEAEKLSEMRLTAGKKLAKAVD